MKISLAELTISQLPRLLQLLQTPPQVLGLVLSGGAGHLQGAVLHSQAHPGQQQPNQLVRVCLASHKGYTCWKAWSGCSHLGGLEDS